MGHAKRLFADCSQTSFELCLLKSNGKSNFDEKLNYTLSETQKQRLLIALVRSCPLDKYDIVYTNTFKKMTQDLKLEETQLYCDIAIQKVDNDKYQKYFLDIILQPTKQQSLSQKKYGCICNSFINYRGDKDGINLFLSKFGVDDYTKEIERLYAEENNAYVNKFVHAFNPFEFEP